MPEGRPVADADDAWEAAEDIGLPVVVKPRDSNHGRGVFTGLTTREQVVSAFAHADGIGSGVLVERFAPGAEHRLLVVDGRVIAASRGEPAVIVGDGARNVAQLIDEQLNSDPRRGEDCSSLLYTIELDAVTTLALEQQGYRADSVPLHGTRILVKRNGNVDTDVTELIHPEVAARAIEAARVVGLDIAGLDIVAEDIGRPLEDQGGAIVEVNAGPGLQMHVQPADGKPRPVGEAIINTMFPSGETGRIPLVAVTGTTGNSETAWLIGKLLWRLLFRTGRSGHRARCVYRDGKRVGQCPATPAGYDGAQWPYVAASHGRLRRVRSFCWTAEQKFAKKASRFRLVDCDEVAVVTRTSTSEHRDDLSDAETVEQISVLKRLCVGGSRGQTEPRLWPCSMPMIRRSSAWRPTAAGRSFFTLAIGNRPKSRGIVAKGGESPGAASKSCIWLTQPWAPLEISLPIGADGKVDPVVAGYALPAAAAAWALGLSAEQITHGMASSSPPPAVA